MVNGRLRFREGLKVAVDENRVTNAVRATAQLYKKTKRDSSSPYQSPGMSEPAFGIHDKDRWRQLARTQSAYLRRTIPVGDPAMR